MSLYFILYTLEKQYNIISTNTNKISTNNFNRKHLVYSPQPAPSPLPHFNPNKIMEYYNVKQTDSAKKTNREKNNKDTVLIT